MHASCIALGGRGLLIIGPSGSGKSALAMTLMSLGADLVADDRTFLRREGEDVVASAPAAIRGLIEARGVGLLRARPVDEATIAVVADLGTAESDRLPPRRTYLLLGCSVDLVLAADNPHVPAALMLYLRHGRHA
jgi:HPr kinase/phosphorylase